MAVLTSISDLKIDLNENSYHFVAHLAVAFGHHLVDSLLIVSFGQDIVLVLSDLCRGSADKKLRWAFHIYDIDGDGVISRSELEDVALSINELTGESSGPPQPTDPLVNSSAVRLWVDRIFQVL